MKSGWQICDRKLLWHGEQSTAAPQVCGVCACVRVSVCVYACTVSHVL